MSDAARTKIDEFLAAQREAQTRFLAELVKTPSDNPPGDCRPHAERAAELLEGLGFKVERHPVPDDLVKANGMISCTNLVIRERFGAAGPTIACNAHGDVVPPGLGWSADPYGAEVRDGCMYGRGVAVSKSDFATYAFALLALRDAVANGGAKLARHRRTALHLRRGGRRLRSVRSGFLKRASRSPTSRSRRASPTA